MIYTYKLLKAFPQNICREFIYFFIFFIKISLIVPEIIAFKGPKFCEYLILLLSI